VSREKTPSEQHYLTPSCKTTRSHRTIIDFVSDHLDGQTKA